MSMITRTENIVNALQRRMDDLTFKWKGSAETDSYTEKKPTVYAFTYDDLSNGMPLNTPSVCVQLLSVDDSGSGKYLAHVCVCNPALQDVEITKPVKGEIDTYEYNTGESIDSAMVRSELYKYCLLLGEQVYLALKRMGSTNQDVRNVELNTPSPYLADFPFCECTVSFESDILTVVETTDRTELESML